jgi:hypothetical protein
MRFRRNPDIIGELKPTLMLGVGAIGANLISQLITSKINFISKLGDWARPVSAAVLAVLAVMFGRKARLPSEIIEGVKLNVLLSLVQAIPAIGSFSVFGTEFKPVTFGDSISALGSYAYGNTRTFSPVPLVSQPVRLGDYTTTPYAELDTTNYGNPYLMGDE